MELNDNLATDAAGYHGDRDVTPEEEAAARRELEERDRHKGINAGYGD